MEAVVPDWFREARHSARVLAGKPAFATVAMLSLALGIGVNVAVLAVARAVMLRPLPVPDPHELVIAYWTRAEGKGGIRQINSASVKDEKTGRVYASNFTYPLFVLRDAAPAADVFAFTFLNQANISIEGQPVMGGGLLVSGNYFTPCACRCCTAAG